MLKLTWNHKTRLDHLPLDCLLFTPSCTCLLVRKSITKGEVYCIIKIALFYFLLCRAVCVLWKLEVVGSYGSKLKTSTPSTSLSKLLSCDSGQVSLHDMTHFLSISPTCIWWAWSNLNIISIIHILIFPSSYK